MSGLSRRRFLGAAGAAGLGTVLGSRLASAATSSSLPCAPGTTVYVGSYTSSPPAGHGLDVTSRAAAGPALNPVRTIAKTPDTSWFDRSRDGRTLYITNEGSPTGSISALNIDDVTKPRLLNTVTSKGDAPTHLSVHSSQKFVVAANYGTGSVVVLPILAGGKLGAATDLVQHAGTEPHAHMVVNDPTGRWLLSVDLGNDSLYVYQLDVKSGKLKQHQQVVLPKGAGPRHLAFHPNGRYVYVAQELRPEITVCTWDALSGKLTPIAVVPAVPAGSTGDLYPGEITVSRDGKFVYATVRGPNTIATFTVSGDGATITRVSGVDTGGNWPRHVALDAEEKWFYVSNQRSGTVTWLPRDPHTGLPGKVAGSLSVPSVNSVYFV